MTTPAPSYPEKTIGILVARMGSTRLPGKVLRLIHDKPLLEYALEHLKSVAGLDEIWLATTQQPGDQPLLLWGIQQELHVYGYPGDATDVVGRISAVANKAKADRFVLAFGHQPFLDSADITTMLDAMDTHSEWEAVRLEGPHGDITGCYRSSSWHKLDNASLGSPNREQIGTVLEAHGGLLCHGDISTDAENRHAWPHSLTVETLADFELIEQVIGRIQQPGKTVSLAEALRYLHAHPEQLPAPADCPQDDGPPHVLFALQAGDTFGTAHLQRCKTLAHTLSETFDAQVTFWVDTPLPQLRQEMAKAGLNVIQGNWSLPEAIHQTRYHRLVIDFEAPLRPTLVERIRMTAPNLPIITVDNLGIGCNDVDAIILPNVHAVANPEWDLSRKPFYHGAPYMTLGHEFLHGKSELPHESPLSRPAILIALGGRGDPEQVSEKILYGLKDLKDCHLDLIVPPAYPHPENLEKIATRLPSTITLHWRIKNLRPLMQRATLAIAAFGMTVYELAYLGIPTLMMSHYQSQLDEMERFAHWKSAINLGWAKTLDADTLQALVTDLLQDAVQRHAMAENGKALAHLDGPRHVAEAILATTRTPVTTTR